MYELSSRLRALIAERGLSYRDLSERTGIAKSAIQRYATGVTQKIPFDRLTRLAEALEVEPAYLMGLEGVFSGRAEGEAVARSRALEALRPIRRRRIPLLGAIAAGRPIFAEQEFESYVPADQDVRADFALEVRGESMLPVFKDGDVVFIREQSDVLDGQVAAVIVDDSATLKRVYHTSNGVQLVSYNSDYPPMLFTRHNSDVVVILGLAVGLYRRV